MDHSEGNAEAATGTEGASSGGAERRRSTRAKTIKKGQIVWQDGHCDMDCLILDLSDGGARLQPEDVLKCPERFTLKTLSGDIYHCRVARRTAKDLGVMFLGRNLPKLLVVCDDSYSLEIYEQEFRKFFTVQSARGLSEAMAILDRDGPFAVIFSDMQISARNGLWVLAEARKRDPDMTRVLLTDAGDSALAVDAINEAYAFAFHTRPCKLDALTKSIGQAVEENRRRTAAAGDRDGKGH